MNKYTFENRSFYFKVFENDGINPFILLSTSDIPSDGISKIYFLNKYSIKYAMEYFYKDVIAIETKRNAVQ
jgi:hypothetical protein